jgi:hypothetical protein
MPVITPSAIILITSIIGAGAATASAIASTHNNKLKREYEQNLAALNQTEKDKLEKDMVRQKTLEARKKLLADTLSNVAQARAKAIEDKKAEEQKSLNNLKLIGGIGGVILIVGLVILYAKKKNK